MKKQIIVSGRRKSAIAKAKINEGTGRITFNGLPYEKLMTFHKLALQEPAEICKQVLGNFNFDIEIKTSGGGKEAQIEAGRQAIAKAVVKMTNSAEIKKAFLEYDRRILVADTRRKETRKPGDSKARAKRQTSYR